MIGIIGIAYLWMSWTCVGMVWPTWLLRLIFACQCRALFSWKTLQMTVVPMVITVFALFPPYTVSLGILYIFLVYIATIVS
jgi:hypothetical protein